jgi:hypothetical protein
MKTMPNKIRKIKSLLLIAVSCWGFHNLQAQRETEVFIPIGKSPGVSDKWSVIGRVTAVNAHDSTVTIAQGSGTKTVKLTGKTDIFLDKNKLKLTNTRGSFADIRNGRMVEAKPKDYLSGSLIEWIKVQLE